MKAPTCSSLSFISNITYNYIGYVRTGQGVRKNGLYVGPRSSLHMSPILSAKVRRNLPQNEQLWQPLDTSNVFVPTFSFKNSQYFQFKE